MTSCTLKFSLSSYWATGSGEGGGAVVDSVVLRDASQLPVIPGRTVKGLLRDAMQLATLSRKVDPERVQRWFGSALPGQGDGDEQEVHLEKGRFSTTEGALWFGSATLPDAWRQWARLQPKDAPVLLSLSTFLASTAIDPDGVAAEHTLRVCEVSVPMELHAEVRGPAGDRTWQEDLRACLPLLRALGTRRNRGFGRVDVTMEGAR